MMPVNVSNYDDYLVASRQIAVNRQTILMQNEIRERLENAVAKLEQNNPFQLNEEVSELL